MPAFIYESGMMQDVLAAPTPTLLFVYDKWT